ncbi:mitochondrial carrier domain-containing protein [Entophlyctis helioformis]|nr:mitochondrial carrier domain-containing protein [Entophlyctis helioformis]
MDARLSPQESPAAAIATSLAAASAPDVKIQRDTRAADLLFGSISGLVGKLVEYPFDTVKVRLQAEPLHINTRSAGASWSSLFNGRTLKTIRDMASQEGFGSFYRGLSAPLVGSMAENSVLFIAYNQVQNSIRSLSGMEPSAPLSMSQLALAGALSGACVSFVLTPVELIKCRLQVQGAPVQESAYQSQTSRFLLSKNPSVLIAGGFGARGHLSEPPLAGSSASGAAASSAGAVPAAPVVPTASGPQFRGTLHVLWHTLRHDGIRGLYRGHLGTMLREVAGGAAWFGTYEFAVKRFVATSPTAQSKEDLSPWLLMAAGALAGVSYNAALFPADVIKSRQQTSPLGTGGFMAVGRELYHAEGIRGLYRGFGITIARSAPTSGVIFMTYELLSRNLTVEMD